MESADIDALVGRYAKVIRDRFPTVLIGHDAYNDSTLFDDQILNVFMVPDSQMSEFLDFMIDYLPEWREREAVPRIGVVPVGVTCSQENYGHVINAPTRDGMIVDYADISKAALKA